MVIKEQQIEVLISLLPGLNNNEDDQARCIKELEEELRIAELQRLDAVEEKNQVLATLAYVICSIKRP